MWPHGRRKGQLQKAILWSPCVCCVTQTTLTYTSYTPTHTHIHNNSKYNLKTKQNKNVKFPFCLSTARFHIPGTGTHIASVRFSQAPTSTPTRQKQEPTSASQHGTRLTGYVLDHLKGQPMLRIPCSSSLSGGRNSTLSPSSHRCLFPVRDR